jgi:tetratricopeptide (TPR) repeat protein
MLQFARTLHWFVWLAVVLMVFAVPDVWGQDAVLDDPLVTGEGTGTTTPDASTTAPPAEGELDATPNVDPAEFYRQKMAEAEALMQEKNWTAAVEAYNQIMATVGRQPRALLNQGICFRELGSDDLAISSLSMALISPGAGQEPGLVEQAYLLRGELYMKTGRYREAVDDFTQAAQLNPSNPDAYFLQGKALLRLVVTSPTGGMDQGGQASLLQAVKALERAIALRGDHGESYLERGRVLFRLRQIDYALQDFQQAVRLMGGSSDASSDLGVAYAFRATQESYQPLAQDSQIIQDLRASIESLSAYLASAKLGQKVPPWETRDPLQARPETALLSRGDTRISLGNELTGEEQQQLYQAALADADQLLQLDLGDDDRARAFYIRGSAQRMLNRLDEAIDALTHSIQAYLSLGGSYSEAHLRRGICYFHQQEYDRALQDFEAASLVPTNPYVYEPRAMMWAGATYAKLGKYEDAIRSYTRSLAASPRYVPAYLNRGLAYLNVGRNDEARRDFDEVLRLDPHNEQAQTYRQLASERS